MYDRILLPLDGSELGEKAIAHTRALARAFHSTVYLLHVVSHYQQIDAARMGDLGPVQTLEMATEHGRRLAEVQQDQARAYLQQVAHDLQRDGLLVHATVMEGSAADCIVDFAARKDVNLIVMSTRGHGGPKRVFMGSVTDHVARSSEVPVLVVPPRST